MYLTIIEGESIHKTRMRPKLKISEADAHRNPPIVVTYTNKGSLTKNNNNNSSW